MISDSELLSDNQPANTTEPLYIADAVKQIEKRATEIGSYPLYDLMLRAGQNAWNVLRAKRPEIKRLLVIAGAGNNAGDGFILACHAQQAGVPVAIMTIKAEPVYKGDALLAYNKAKEAGIELTHFNNDQLKQADVVVDAILGTGFSGDLRPEYCSAIEAINCWRTEQKGWVFSLDIPSGLDADTGVIKPIAVRSDHCISFINLKPGMVTGKAREFCESWELDDLQISNQSRDGILPTAWIDDAKHLIHSMPGRRRTSHKGDFGHLLLIGGDYGFGGAILMSAQAAGRVGVGRLTILTRDSHVAPILTQFPEAMIRSIEQAEDPMLDDILKSVDAVVIGPGLGTGDWGQHLMLRLIEADCPILVDADGLNNLVGKNLNRSNWVVTPHPGEASRLLGTSVKNVEANRYESAQNIHDKLNATVVLKGAGTIIVSEGQSTVCDRGNPGMATAGMGDILSGIIGSLMAQGFALSEAARIGVALHAVAGDIAAEKGEKGLLATDLLSPLRQLVNET